MRRQFSMSEAEQAYAEEFITGYLCSPQMITAISYRFTETGIGVALEVSCSCGEKQDITDYGEW